MNIEAGNICKLRGCLVGVLLIGLAFPAGVQACSCLSPRTPWEARTRADAVFSGTVLDIQRRDVSLRVTFELDKAWKGISKQQVTIQTRASSASCGYSFETGERYLVYAQSDENAYRTHLCTRTVRLEDAQPDMEAFEQLFLGANYPEPFQDKTTIPLGLPRRMTVSLNVFDRSGRLVKTLVDDALPPGTHKVVFDGSSLPGGVYVYRLQVGGRLLTRTMVLAR